MEPKWKPIAEFPRTLKEDAFEEEDFLDSHEIIFRRGTVLRRKDGTLVLLGNDLCGHRTKGCDCCSCDWIYQTDRYTHYLEPEEVIPSWLLDKTS